jgi:hypothetical protein
MPKRIDPDPGAGHPPPPNIESADLITTRAPALTWWRSAHRKAASPLEFSNARGRFSGPGLPKRVLYLGEDPVACFWECGLGRDLLKRSLGAREVTRAGLMDRMEYRVGLRTTTLRLFDTTNPAAWRKIGASTMACFTGDHAVSRTWAAALMGGWARLDGLIYRSARHSTSLCLVLFETAAALGALKSSAKAVRSSWQNHGLLASFLAEGVTGFDTGIRRARR